MAAVSSSLLLTGNPRIHPSSGFSLKPLNQSLGNASIVKLSLGLNNAGKLRSFAPSGTRPLSVQASYRDYDRPSSAGLFVGGFVLGGLIMGALGCVYAPQISKTLAGTDRKDLMKKLPKFIYDEEKALEKTRKVLAEKIAQLNSAIDDVSSQLRTEDEAPKGAATNSDEAEAAV